MRSVRQGSGVTSPVIRTRRSQLGTLLEGNPRLGVRRGTSPGEGLPSEGPPPGRRHHGDHSRWSIRGNVGRDQGLVRSGRRLELPTNGLTVRDRLVICSQPVLLTWAFAARLSRLVPLIPPSITVLGCRWVAVLTPSDISPSFPGRNTSQRAGSRVRFGQFLVRVPRCVYRTYRPIDTHNTSRPTRSPPTRRAAPATGRSPSRPHRSRRTRRALP